jgi:hypothetical protein
MTIHSTKVPDKCLHNTLADLMAAVLQHIPHAQFDTDTEGQIIIYTDLKVDSSGDLQSFEIV